MAALLFTAGGVLGEAADQANLKIDEHGVVTMVKDDSNQDVNKLVLKVDGDNQITMDKDGIQVGKNNIVIGSDGTIKGANERFSVGPDGKVTAAYGKIGTVEITSAGAVSGVTDLTVSGDVEAVGNLTVGNGNFTLKPIAVLFRLVAETSIPRVGHFVPTEVISMQAAVPSPAAPLKAPQVLSQMKFLQEV